MLQTNIATEEAEEAELFNHEEVVDQSSQQKLVYETLDRIVWLMKRV